MNSNIGLFVLSVVIAVTGYFNYTKDAVVVTESNLAGFAGPDMLSDYHNFNGFEKQFKTQGMAIATTSVCAIKAPSATSTLSGGVVRVSTSTNYTITVAKSATPWSTTTAIMTKAVTEDGEVVYPMSSTTVNATSQADTVFSPGQWLVVSLTGAETFRAPGACSAEFSLGQ